MVAKPRRSPFRINDLAEDLPCVITAGGTACGGEWGLLLRPTEGRMGRARCPVPFGEAPAFLRHLGAWVVRGACASIFSPVGSSSTAIPEVFILDVEISPRHSPDNRLTEVDVPRGWFV